MVHVSILVLIDTHYPKISLLSGRTISNWLVPHAAEGFCSPLRVNRCQSGSGRSCLDYQMTRAADSSLVVIK